jgi:hypothetical protein
MASVRRNLPTILLACSLPAGLLGYIVGVRLIGAVAPGNSLLELFVPLFIAGVCMMPFLVPWLDRRAKADLAAIRALREAEGDAAAPKGDERTDDPTTDPTRG